MLSTRTKTLLLVALFCIAAGPAAAQTTGAISGSVKDETGGVLPGAEVVITNTATGVTRNVFADENGLYKATNLNIGSYQVSASMGGFQPVVRSGIELTIGREAVVDITMKLGELTDQVTVVSDAPLVDTRSGAMGSVVSRETILEIPLNGRDLTGLISLQAGTTTPTTTSEGASQGYSNKFSISGSRVGDNSVLLDGTEVKSFDGGVPAGVSGSFLGGEAIQEFKVERNSYSAEFGGASGGVVNVVSKSGTNDFHGSLYGFTRNDALDAANFRAVSQVDASGAYSGKQKPNFSRYQYGASAGGRVIRNKTFYFANWEGMREDLQYPGFVNTLSASARQGILPGGNVTVNPAVVPYLALWPLPAGAVDLGDGTARYSVTQTQPTEEDFYQGRLDHNFSSSDAVFGRVTRQTSHRFAPAAISRWGGNDSVYNTFVTGEYRKILSSRVLNTARFGYNRRGIKQFSTESPGVEPGLFIVPADKWLSPLGADPIMGSFLVSGLSEVGLGRGWVDRAVNRFQFVDSFVYTRGAHTFKVGGDWQILHMDGDSPSRPGGELTFASIRTLLLGQPRQFRGDVLPETDSIRHLRWNQIGWYGQYDWQAGPHLTLNLGLRQDFYTVPTETEGRIANLKDPYNDRTVTVLGTNGDSWWENPSFKNFSPRIGMAWDPFGTGKTSVRAGAGIFHNLIQAETFRQFAWRTAPFALESNIVATEGTIPFPNVYDYIVRLGSAQGDMFIFPYSNMGNPRMMQWNANVQREIGGNMAVTIGYAGSKGKDLINHVYLNTARANLVDGVYVFPANAARPNSAFNLNLASPQTIGESWYHGFQAELQRRFKGGWQMQFSYSKTKSTDTASAFLPTFDGGAAGASPYVYDQTYNKGLSAFNVGQRFSASGIWILPFGGESGLRKVLLGGWQLSGIVNVSAGSPLNVSIAARSALAALGVGAQSATERPNLIADGDSNPVLGNPDLYFDASQFSMPGARSLGNLGRNTLIGPGLVTVDLSFTKNTAVRSIGRVQFRVEVFNLLNRANLGSPDVQVFTATGTRRANAGFIDTTSTAARQIQLGLRFDW